MTDVFISYASEDRERVRTLASTLEACGWSVWWDRHIVVGQSFDQAIEHEIETAKCVVVLWSKDSISSEWVKNEAAVAAERGVLVPALIDNIKIPLEFRRKQTADLVTWDGAFDHAGFQALRDGIATKTSKTGVAARQSNSPPLRASQGRRNLALGATAAVAVAGLVAVLFQAGAFSGSGNQRPPLDSKGIAAVSSPPNMPELESRSKVADIAYTGNAAALFFNKVAVKTRSEATCLRFAGDVARNQGFKNAHKGPAEVAGEKGDAYVAITCVGRGQQPAIAIELLAKLRNPNCEPASFCRWERFLLRAEASLLRV